MTSPLSAESGLRAKAEQLTRLAQDAEAQAAAGAQFAPMSVRL